MMIINHGTVETKIMINHHTNRRWNKRKNKGQTCVQRTISHGRSDRVGVSTVSDATVTAAVARAAVTGGTTQRKRLDTMDTEIDRHKP